MTDLALIRQALPDLVEQLLADGELDDMDLAVLHDAMVAQANATKEAKASVALAHLHDEPHGPVVTLEPVALEAYLAAPEWRTVEVDGQFAEEQVPAAERVPELVDASGLVCHDCGRALVADVSEARVLVCPTIHGKRPPYLVPTHPDGAVECGRAAA